MNILFVILMCILCFWLGFALPYHVYTFFQRKRAKQEFKSLIPDEVDEDRLCKNSHTWEEARSLTDDGNIGTTNICTTCGFIPSKNMMASKASMDKVKEGNRIRAFEAKVDLEFEDMEQSYLKDKLDDIKKDPTYEKIREVYLSGLSAPRRYAYHKAVKMVEMENKENL